MSDAVDDGAAPGKPVLDYPFAAAPERGRTLEVAPGVHWIRMPLPYALDHINLWVLDDGAGWALVDTGVRNEETAAAWRELFASAPDSRSLTRTPRRARRASGQRRAANGQRPLAFRRHGQSAGTVRVRLQLTKRPEHPPGGWRRYPRRRVRHHYR